jgi:hypothetical protein
MSGLLEGDADGVDASSWMKNFELATRRLRNQVHGSDQVEPPEHGAASRMGGLPSNGWQWHEAPGKQLGLGVCLGPRGSTLLLGHVMWACC